MLMLPVDLGQVADLRTSRAGSPESDHCVFKKVNVGTVAPPHRPAVRGIDEQPPRNIP